jgi:hypothetical protein
MPFEPGRSGNPAGGPVGSRHRQQLNGEFIAALLRDFRHGGPKAIERVRRTQPAVYLKILALLVPREHKVQHSNPIKDLTDEQLEAMIEYIKTSLEAQAGDPVKVIEGMIEPTTVPATALPVLEPPKRKPNRLMMEVDTAIGPQERKPRKRADFNGEPTRVVFSAAHESADGTNATCGPRRPMSAVAALAGNLSPIRVRGAKKKQGFVARISLSLSPGYEFNLPFERPGVGSDGGPRR